MPLEATQIDLETMILNATNQKEKDKYIGYHFSVESKI